MQRGRVKWSNDAKDYGFNVLESEQDRFVQYRGLVRRESRNAVARSSSGKLPAFKVRAQSRIRRVGLEA
jgi:hypothetical protein